MSYKGITRGIARVPQQFKAKFNLGEVTKDQVYIDAERRFKEFDQDCKKLNEEFKRYFNAIKGMGFLLWLPFRQLVSAIEICVLLTTWL